jgi:hypothetical protein
MSAPAEPRAAPVAEPQRLADVVQARLAELRLELEHGRHELGELDARREELGRLLLRIGGAVQVLEELLGGQR